MQTSEILNDINSKMLANPASVDLAAMLPQKGGITDNFTSKIVGCGYIATTVRLTNPQTIKMSGNDADIVIPAGEMAASFSISFEDKTSCAVTVLRRSAKSKINGRAIRLFSYPELIGLIGQELTVVSSLEDASTKTTTNYKNADGVPEPRTTIGKEFIITCKA